MSGNYDVQQVCKNGHQITGSYNIRPDKRKDFCQECGETTIIACPSCGEAIEGTQIKARPDYSGGRSGHSGIVPGSPVGVPDYCSNCGKPYPWRENTIVAAIQMFAELGIDENEESTIDEDMHNIAKDIPQAKPSAMRIKRICDKYGTVAYNVVMEFASKTAAEVLKNQ